MEPPPTSRVLETPLAKAHAQAGAKMGMWFGCALPDHFADPEREFRFANESVALIDKNYRAYLSFSGPDRVRYLNAILTNNIKDLAVGHGNVSLLLNPQGHILAELETYAFAERHLCVSYAMIREHLIEWMDKYIIMDDVTLTDETVRYGTLAVEGPCAADVAQEIADVRLARLSELTSVDGEIPRQKTSKAGAILCRVVKRSPGGVAGAEFVTERERLAELWEALLEVVRRHDGGPAGYVALNAQRLAQGVAWFGYDFSDKQIPHEAGLEDSHISYTKGCYTGQEIVERVRSRGQVHRRRVQLQFEGEAVPEAGAVLMVSGNEVGTVTRAARAWNPPRVIGMGYVKSPANAPGTTLQWAGGATTVI